MLRAKLQRPLFILRLEVGGRSVGRRIRHCD